MCAAKRCRCRCRAVPCRAGIALRRKSPVRYKENHARRKESCGLRRALRAAKTCTRRKKNHARCKNPVRGVQSLRAFGRLQCRRTGGCGQVQLRASADGTGNYGQNRQNRRNWQLRAAKIYGLVCARSSLSFMARPTPTFGARWQYRPFGEILSSLRNSAKRLAAASAASPASDSQ